jgi:uncharacterized protein with PQ loop repeat
VLTNTGLLNSILYKQQNDRLITNYKEKTAAFSYYVITGLLMTDWENTLKWCYETNEVPIKFNNRINNISSFITLIRQTVNNEDNLYLWWCEEEQIPSSFYKYPLTAKMTI